MPNSQILYISYDGLTDPLGQSQILPYLQGLSASGYQFTILSFEKKHRYEKEGATIRHLCEQSGIDWQPLWFTGSPPIISKVYDRWQMKKAVKRLHKLKRFDMIHCRSYIAAEMGLKMKRQYGTRFFFDMRGFWADEKVDGGQWNLHNPFFKQVYRHYKRKEKEFLLQADAIVSLTKAAKLELLSKPGFEELEIEVIPCCADLAHFDYNRVQEAQKAEAAHELNIPTRAKVISYLGSVGGWYMTREMFDFFQALRGGRPEYIMVILSKDDPERILRDAAEAGIPADAIRIRYATRKELPVLLALSDCSIFFIRPTYSKMASSPTKHAELMGMGLPVICNEIGDTGHIVRDTGTGEIVAGFNKERYSEVIAKMDELLKIPASKIRQAAFRYFDLDDGIRRYGAIYKRLLANQ